MEMNLMNGGKLKLALVLTSLHKVKQDTLRKPQILKRSEIALLRAGLKNSFSDFARIDSSFIEA